ncbi:MAG: hypothetical protein B6U86_03275 [Candidatus Altiarchaeales archaeon ex4484_43]|nr:MAG: hypothetical protein B6U86_03275 [Candidatus Altiarchaeales archaeon ex4484_43]
MEKTDEKLKKYVVLKLVSELGRIDGRTKFQKLVFIGQKEFGLPEAFKFSGYYYGPYSKDLTETIEALIRIGFLHEEVKVKDEYIEYIYTITEEGKGALRGLEKEIKKKLPKTAISHLRDFKKMSRGEIIGYVYGKYMSSS